MINDHRRLSWFNDGKREGILRHVALGYLCIDSMDAWLSV